MQFGSVTLAKSPNLPVQAGDQRALICVTPSQPDLPALVDELLGSGGFLRSFSEGVVPSPLTWQAFCAPAMRVCVNITHFLPDHLPLTEAFPELAEVMRKNGFEFTCWNGDIVRGAFIIDATTARSSPGGPW